MRYIRPSAEFPREIYVNDVFSALAAIIKHQECMMAAIDDLTGAVSAAVQELAALKALVTNLNQQLASATGAATNDQLEALATQLTTATQDASSVNPASTNQPAAPAA